MDLGAASAERDAGLGVVRDQKLAVRSHPAGTRAEHVRCALALQPAKGPIRLLRARHHQCAEERPRWGGHSGRPRIGVRRSGPVDSARRAQRGRAGRRTPRRAAVPARPVGCRRAAARSARSARQSILAPQPRHRHQQRLAMREAAERERAQREGGVLRGTRRRRRRPPRLGRGKRDQARARSRQGARRAAPGAACRQGPLDVPGA